MAPHLPDGTGRGAADGVFQFPSAGRAVVKPGACGAPLRGFGT